jgi:hypothetical protein
MKILAAFLLALFRNYPYEKIIDPHFFMLLVKYHFARPSFQTLVVAYKVQPRIVLVKILPRCLTSHLKMRRVQGKWYGRTLGPTQPAR